MDPSTEWVIESAPGFVAIKHKMGCTIRDASASHCMATKWSYEIQLAEKDVSHAVAEAWPELVRYQDNYYHLLKDYNILKESAKSAEAQAKESWAVKNGYCLSNIPASDGEDDEEDPTGLPTIPEEIPQYIPTIPPNHRAHTMSKPIRNDSKVVQEAGIPAIGGYYPPAKQKKIIADPPASITGVPPKPLGKSRAEQWDQPAFRGASEWILEQNIHDAEIHRLYTEAKALQPHERSPDHTAVMFHTDEYARSLPGLPRNLVAHHDDPNWVTEVIQNFNLNPSGVPQNLRWKVYMLMLTMPMYDTGST
ncbi:hypothetical protein M422DRAFT_258049 [Sphaerobolus stellatus SS14]|uniref:Uncharacterized protein n=1 Tax=Sphaerobolus stellatus (strain SS14) TaxID=990650 RepID=A0A0C9VC72_SPHS4|nr:hypothetical protein M422DRAFT_258049 [Sphaerobolus stellatus SS14]